MAGLTVAEAQTRVGDLLDDPNGVRWSAAKVLLALRPALSTCLMDYAGNGGNAFDEPFTGTTSATGTLTLTDPVQHIRSVQVVTGNRRIAIRSVSPQDIEMTDVAARALRIVGIREWVVPSTTTNRLVSDDTTTGPSWQAFDQWVCAQAALDLGITDNDKRPGLEKAWARYRDSAINRVATPRSRAAPLPRSDWSFADDLGWAWDATTQTIQLGRIRGELW